MSIEEQINKKLQTTFEPEHLDVINESHKHVGHAGHDGRGDSHFKVIIVSSHFENQSRIARERMLSQCLQDEFATGLHALSIKAFTPTEYH